MHRSHKCWVLPRVGRLCVHNDFMYFSPRKRSVNPAPLGLAGYAAALGYLRPASAVSALRFRFTLPYLTLPYLT